MMHAWSISCSLIFTIILIENWSLLKIIFHFQYAFLLLHQIRRKKKERKRQSSSKSSLNNNFILFKYNLGNKISGDGPVFVDRIEVFNDSGTLAAPQHLRLRTLFACDHSTPIIDWSGWCSAASIPGPLHSHEISLSCMYYLKTFYASTTDFHSVLHNFSDPIFLYVNFWTVLAFRIFFKSQFIRVVRDFLS